MQAGSHSIHFAAGTRTFEPAGEGGCEVSFRIDYEFKSRMLGVVMGTMFDRAFRMFTEAFEKRADEIYG